MKIKEGFLLREVGTLAVVVAVGEASRDFHKILTLNTTGAFLWRKLQNGASEKELVNSLCEEYEVENTLAKKDVQEFIEKVNGAGLIEN